MTAWRIAWSDLVDDGLVREIEGAAGGEAPASEDVRRPVARILAAAGGWPYVEKLPTASRVRAHVRRLLGEALARAAGGRGPGPSGYQLVESAAGAVRIEPAERVEVNFATTEVLRTLPGISARVASAIVDERQRHGPFRSLRELTDRVDGFGPKRAAQLGPRLGFRREAGARAATGVLRDDLAALAAREAGATAGNRLVAALERVARVAEDERHPHLKHRSARPFDAPAAPRLRPAETCAVLAGRRYYTFVRKAIGGARERIDVAMYHVAMPGEDHPTRQLLDALVRAHRRGVAVRVLVDRDRRDDLYRSVVINAAAIQYLLARGLRVRVDSAVRLLHSKFLVLDGSLTVIGSHNWSVGSYFGYDDLSVAVESGELARDVRRRFDGLWRRGETARLGRGTAPR